jgi:16S rRNA (adenine1518-N6/adenine1519-N6)-dimethyltransferase
VSIAHPHRKRFGQHFLRDPAVILRIIEAIAPKSDEHLVEIGPGLGVLTAALLEAADRLEVIELDRDLIPGLKRHCRGRGALRIHNADALTFDFQRLCRDESRLRVVGNLPYNISTPLLFHLLAQTAHIHDMHFMLQKEVVERMAAAPNRASYGRLSVMLQYRCSIEWLFTIGAEAFSPPPKVESAFVRLIPYQRPPVQVTDFQHFSTLVKQAFSQRRKTLRNALRNMLAGEDIEAAGINPSARPENLALADFAALSNFLTWKEIT